MKTKRLFGISLIVLLLTSCRSTGGLVYPDTGYADDKSDSWLQRSEEDITINWFVNYSGWGTAATLGTKVGNRIYEKTGIKINFSTPISDSSDKLNTMIASDELPDVITVGAGSDDRIQLGEGNYTYSLEELAKRYAPSLLKRIDSDVLSYFKQSDGSIHSLPNHFYTQSDLKAYEEQEGRQLLSNGAMLCRKDYLDAYLEANPMANPTTPSGFKEMCLWVKNKYQLKDTNPTFLLDYFDTASGSNGLLFLQEYFCVPKESEDGKLLNMNAQPRNKEMYMWLNDLYTSKIIASNNFSIASGQIGQYISKGFPFAFVGSPQLYTYAFKEAYQNGYQYVPVVMTNKDGEAPLLRSLAGNGWLCSMITHKCAHPDRVIKLFDYLWSTEGQSLFYGIENEDFTYEVPIGGTKTKTVDGVDKEVTYKYGLIKYKDEVWQDIINEDVGKYGFGYSNIFVNPMYPRLTSEYGEVLNSYGAYIDYNGKASLIDYTYYNGGFEFCRDSSKAGFNDILKSSNNVTRIWARYAPQIINAKSSSAASDIFDSTVRMAKDAGSDKVLAFDQDAFAKNKANLNLRYAWPKNDPESPYQSLSVTSIYGNTSYFLDIPEEFKK